MNRGRLTAAWTTLTIAFALHVWDEAAHGFLAMYTPVAAAIRARLGGFPLPPDYTRTSWLLTLGCIIAVLFALLPGVRRRGEWVVPAAYAYATVQLLNAVAHTMISIAARRVTAGTWTAPLLFVPAWWLAREAHAAAKSRPSRSSTTHSTAPPPIIPN
jgi:hypothetical protein